MGLTLGGLVVGLLGVVAVAGQSESDRVVSTLMGIGFGSMGAVMVVTGIPLWAVGEARLQEKPEKEKAPAISLSLGAASAAVEGRF